MYNLHREPLMLHYLVKLKESSLWKRVPPLLHCPTEEAMRNSDSCGSWRERAVAYWFLVLHTKISWMQGTAGSKLTQKHPRIRWGYCTLISCNVTSGKMAHGLAICEQSAVKSQHFVPLCLTVSYHPLFSLRSMCNICNTMPASVIIWWLLCSTFLVMYWVCSWL